MTHAAGDPAALSALLDARGGEGWLALYHGDLAAAMNTFEGVDSSSARLGLARTHLARADVMRSALRLHREAALELARYRRDHRAQVRTGPYELLLAGLTANAAGMSAAEIAEFVSQTPDPPPAPGDAALTAALGSLLEGTVPADGLPELYAARLQYARAATAGDLTTAHSFSAQVHSREPDVRDPLGRDAEEDLVFEGLFYDEALARGNLRYHLAHAWIEASRLEGPGPLIAAAVEAAWGEPLPEALVSAAKPAAEPLPEWTALFTSPAIDGPDWVVYWGAGAASDSFAARLDAALPEVALLTASSAAEVDGVLRVVTGSMSTFAAAIEDSAAPDGKALVADLELARPPVDRALRSAMTALTEAGRSAQAKRLGDRAVDANPGSRGGADDSARTRVSYRNDRAFLIELSRTLWRAGQIGAALDFVHPLAEEDPALQSVKHYLGQLDAASTIGMQGKTNQL